MRKVLTRKFFERGTVIVAEELLGKFLVRRVRGKEIVVMITEVEAYDGHKDKASHAHRGRTKRNEPMFGGAGVWYVYLCYGMHHMLNVVTGAKEYPAAVLVRCIEANGKRVCGPGRVTKFLNIDKKLNAKQVSKDTGLWIEDRGVRVVKKDIQKTPRIGVDYAGPVWSKKRYRFYIKPHRSEAK